MPRAIKISSEVFSEFEKAYSYLAETERHQQNIQNAIEQHSGKTLIITEGATDWKHMKAAYESLKGKYEEYKDMNFEFLEYEPKNSNKNGCNKLDMGNDNLKNMCERCSKWKHARKLIFIADPDDKDIKKILSKEDEPYYRNWGNNVFSFVLPVPPHRKDTPLICIEHYYTDEEIKTPMLIDGVEYRLYMGNEFDDDGVGIYTDIICTDRKPCGESSIKIIDGSTSRTVHIMREKKSQKQIWLYQK